MTAITSWCLSRANDEVSDLDYGHDRPTKDADWSSAFTTENFTSGYDCQRLSRTCEEDGLPSTSTELVQPTSRET